MWIEDDVLLRCRHLKSDGSRLTIFRAFFNTAFIETLHLRFEKKDLDDAYVDKRVPSTFTVDMYLADEEPEEA